MGASRTDVALLPEELGMYIDAVRERYPAIEEVWVFRRPIEAGERWELLLMADDAVLEGLRGDRDLQRDDVELLVVTDGNRFASAWGSRPASDLTSIGWRLDDGRTASYDDRSSDGTLTASRAR